MAKSSTAARVLARTRPPEIKTVTDGCATSRLAMGKQLVTTVSSLPAGSNLASAPVVVPESKRIVPRVGTNRMADSAIWAFSSDIR